MDFKKTIIALLFLYTSTSLYGQFPTGLPPDSDNQSNFPTGNPLLSDSAIFAGIPDSTVIKFFNLQDVDKRTYFTDTSLGNYFHAIDISRARDREYMNLGNAGSAARPILYNPEHHMGTNYGYHAYDVYNLSLENFRFYDVNRPFGDFTFSPVGGQQNFIVKSDFARSFADGVNLSMNYHRINQEGFYTEQAIKHTNFGLGVHIQPDESKHELFLNFLNIVNTEEHNGGIVSFDAFNELFGDERMSIAVTNSGGALRYQERILAARHIFSFLDSLSVARFKIESAVSFETGYNKYSDASTTTDQGYYGDYLTEDRGLRHYLGYRRLRLNQYLIGDAGKGITGKAGIEYTIHRLNNESTDFTRNDLFLTGSGIVPISKRLKINAVGKLGLGSISGDFLAKGSSELKLKKGIYARGSVAFYRKRHPLTAIQLITNESEVLSNDYAQPFGSDIKVEIAFPFLDLRLGFNQYVGENQLFWNENQLPELLDGTFSATVIDASANISWWKFNMYNYVGYQIFSNNIYHLPAFLFKNRTYLTGKPFKGALEYRLGLESRIIPQHDGVGFNPIAAEFYTSEESLDLFPNHDLFLLAKVKEFRFFLRYENVFQLINRKVYAEAVNYPQYDTKLRIGVRWILYD